MVKKFAHWPNDGIETFFMQTRRSGHNQRRTGN